METVKGFRDFSEEEALKRQAIKEIIIKKFKSYGFLPAETPVIEYEKFVKAGEDEIISDIFKLQDKGKRKLALRYELTFQLKRLAKNKKLPYRRYQIGEVFRDEPVSKARFREFTQCDVDVIGSTTKDEAEILKLFSEILKELEIDTEIYINNRKLINEILEKEGIKKKEQVIKEIDKLDKLSEQEVRKNLKKYKAENLLTLFKKPESFFKKYKAYKEIQELERYCKNYGVKVKFLSSLARGLAYYNGSVFEIKVKKIKESIGGGGSYIINGIQSTGISFGLERLSTITKIKVENIKCLIISIKQEKEAIKIAEQLRKRNISCFIMDKISKALDYANKQKIPFVIFIGAEEIKKGKIKLRNMKTGKEKLLRIPEIIKFLK
ncbi:MAG: histidine--tRNA ligase [Candidatus Pacearchaeota archaeon]|nr:MAG: histidine--tRNA ligase [Candidatus Pacearchaeota archaeon]